MTRVSHLPATILALSGSLAHLVVPSQARAQQPRELTLGAPLSDVLTNGNYGRRSRILDAALPDEWDWRAMRGIDFASPVKNQARCGSCVAFAVASTFETQMNIATGTEAQPWSFSTQHLFSCGGGSCASGWQVDFAMDFLVRKGLPEEACFPYTSGALGDEPECKLSCSDAKSRSIVPALRVRSQPVVGASIDEVKEALLGGPLVTTMKVFDDLYLYKSGVYRHKKGKVAGGHAVMLLGWSNAQKAWIVRNSWGTQFGMGGDFLISWDDPSGVGGKFFGVEPPTNLNAVMLEGIRDRQFLRGTQSIRLRSHGFEPASAELEIRGANNLLLSKPFDASMRLQLEPKDMADGVYTMQIRARNSAGAEKISQAYLVFVRNSEPRATIAIRRISKNMNVWETIVPQFEVESRPVPLERIQYRLLNAAGETVYTKFAPHTADTVGIAFNPANVPVGHYVMIAEAVSDDGRVLATDKTEFNVIPE